MWHVSHDGGNSYLKWDSKSDFLARFLILQVRARERKKEGGGRGKGRREKRASDALM